MCMWISSTEDPWPKATFDNCSAALDFVPFTPLSDKVCLQRYLDGASKPIYITGGMPFGNSVQTRAYVRMQLDNTV